MGPQYADQLILTGWAELEALTMVTQNLPLLPLHPVQIK